MSIVCQNLSARGKVARFLKWKQDCSKDVKTWIAGSNDSTSFNIAQVELMSTIVTYTGDAVVSAFPAAVDLHGEIENRVV